MTDDWKAMIVLFLAIYTIIGFLEFAVSSWIFMNQTYDLASEGEVVEFGRVFSAWFSNIIYHLVIDALISAVISPIVLLLKRI